MALPVPGVIALNDKVLEYPWSGVEVSSLVSSIEGTGGVRRKLEIKELLNKIFIMVGSQLRNT